MRVDIVSIFPEYFAPLDLSLIGKARAHGHARAGRARPADLDPRRAPHGRRHPVRRRPGHGDAAGAVGRGAGRARRQPGRHRPGWWCRRPAGAPFTQAMAHELAAEPHLVFACGRYEGIDQRVLDHAATRMPVTEVSLGDYVLFGGEVAVLVILEAVTRLLPGVLGNADSLAEESHAARAAGGAGLHQAGDLARAGGAGGAALRRPRPDRPLAAGRRRCCVPRPAGPTCSPRCPRTTLDKRDRAPLDRGRISGRRRAMWQSRGVAASRPRRGRLRGS